MVIGSSPRGETGCVDMYMLLADRCDRHANIRYRSGMRAADDVDFVV